MLALLTSCDRFDLLRQTVDSLLYNQQDDLFIVITEDSDKVIPQDIREAGDLFWYTNKTGQHAAIERALDLIMGEYYLHCEDDWLFDNTYDWIAESVKIMEADPSVIKVLCRNGSPHPCTHDRATESGIAYGILQPWENDGITWKGFSWNPGVTRLDLLRQFVPFGQREQDVAEAIHDAGYKVAELSIPIYTHLGDGRSTPR